MSSRTARILQLAKKNDDGIIENNRTEDETGQEFIEAEMDTRTELCDNSELEDNGSKYWESSGNILRPSYCSIRTFIYRSTV